MVLRNLLRAAFGMFLVVLALTPSVGASGNAEKTTYVTFSQPVSLPGVPLAAGTYIFELASPASASGPVRVSSRDRQRHYFLGFTTPVERPRGLRSDAAVSLGESARGSAPPVVAWWPMGESRGHAFIYR